MITIQECNELVKKSGMTLHEFTKKTGKSDKNIAVSICNSKNKMLGERISRGIALAHNELCEKFFGKRMTAAIGSDPFMSVDKFGELITYLAVNPTVVAERIGKSPKFLYITLINSGGISYKLCVQLFHEYETEMRLTLSKEKVELIEKYIRTTGHK